MEIVARQSISGLIEPVCVGVVCASLTLVVPWIEGPLWANVALAAWLLLGGCVFVAAGIFGWRPKGIGLVLSEGGIVWNMAGWTFTARSAVIRWEDIAEARWITWSDEYDEPCEGIILCLHESASNPIGARHAKWLQRELQRRFGGIFAANSIFLHHHKWQWHPAEVARRIQQKVREQGQCGN